MKKVFAICLFFLLFFLYQPQKTIAQPSPDVCTCLYNMTTNQCDLSENCISPNVPYPPCIATTPGTCPGCSCVTPTPTPTGGPVPTIPTGQVCCADNDQDCVNQLGPGWVCEDFAMGCVNVYPNTPNECVLDVIPTPIPGSGCNYTECRNDADCDQISDCSCLGYVAGIQRGLCYPPSTYSCGEFMERCCEPNFCEGSLEPMSVQMSLMDMSVIDICFCFLGSNDPPTPQEPPMKCVPENQSGEVGIDTAVGCIPILTEDTNPFTKFVLGLFIGLGGGTSFVLTIVAGAMITLSAGNPRKIAAGHELFVAAFSGLLFLIFSVFMLRFLGVDILGIPGF